MHRQVVAAFPGILDDGGVADVDDLLLDVEFAESIQLFRVTEAVELIGIEADDVLDMPQPVVDQAMFAVLQRRLHPTAAVVTTDDDVLDAQDIDGELQHREAVEVGMDDDIGDIAMDEDFARRQVDDLVGRDATVGTADPEVVRRLLPREALEEAGIPGGDALGPGAILVEEVFQFAHGVAVFQQAACVST